MGTLNYTTTVPSLRTIGEMQAMLGQAGATAVAIQYVDGGPAGISFGLRGPAGTVETFALPVDVNAVHQLLIVQERDGKLAHAKKAKAGTYTNRAHAERVAWRVAKDWLEAQLAIVEAQLATLDQVMLPYLVLDHDAGTTLYDRYLEQGRRAIGAS